MSPALGSSCLPDHWNHLGNDGWSYRDVLPYFKRFENDEGGASEYRGTGGPLPIRNSINPSVAAQTFVAAAVERGFRGMPWALWGQFGHSVERRNPTRARTFGPAPQRLVGSDFQPVVPFGSYL